MWPCDSRSTQRPRRQVLRRCNFRTLTAQRRGFASDAMVMVSEIISSSDPLLNAAALGLFETLAFWRAPLLMLKQSMSATTPGGNAAYQAYVTVDARV